MSEYVGSWEIPAFDHVGWFVYVIYDTRAPIYVGSTNHPVGRVGWHLTNRDWRGAAHRVEWYRCAGKEEARSLEQLLIRELAPAHNGTKYVPFASSRYSLSTKDRSEMPCFAEVVSIT